MQYWASLIADAERPSLLSPREGKYLKRVPPEGSLSEADVAANLEHSIRSRLYEDSPLLLLTFWSEGKSMGNVALRVGKVKSPQESMLAHRLLSASGCPFL